MDDYNALLSEVNEIRKKMTVTHRDQIYEYGKVITNAKGSAFALLALPVRLYITHRRFNPISGDFDEESLKGLSEDEKKAQLMQEKSRLKQYNRLDTGSGQYILGREAYITFRSPKNWLTAPVRFVRSYTKLKRDRNDQVVIKQEVVVGNEEKICTAVLFVATNGVGLGHLTRCLAVARRMKKKKPELCILFLTTSIALTLIKREGFIPYCVPSRELIPDISIKQWNAMLASQLTQLFDLYDIPIIVFDGATPYASITATIANQNVYKIWMKRGGDKNNSIANARKEKEGYFDRIIVPGELSSQEAPSEKHWTVNPIVYLDKEDLWTREEVRTFLKVPEDKMIAYIQLGAGNINDIHSDIHRIICEIRKHRNVIMVLGESIIGDELKVFEKDVIVIKDYPNEKYFNGFDFAVSACGYNSFYELVHFGVPTVFVPNLEAKTDDQYARAIRVQNNNAGFVTIDTNAMSEIIDVLCDVYRNRELRENLRSISFENGANEAAEIILNSMQLKGCGV